MTLTSATSRNLFSTSDLKIFTKNSIILELDKFSIPRASIVTVTGRNGSGKTSLLNFVAGIESKLKVSYTLLSKNFSLLSYAPDNSYNYFGSLTPAVIFSFIDKKYSRNVNEIRKNIGFQDQLLSKKITDLSYGEQKKVYLIICLAKKSDLYIFDEPFSGLDESSVNYLIEQIKYLKNIGKSVIIVDHNLSLLKSISDMNCELQ